jgi:hypothetical protein
MERGIENLYWIDGDPPANSESPKHVQAVDRRHAPDFKKVRDLDRNTNGARGVKQRDVHGKPKGVRKTNLHEQRTR